MRRLILACVAASAVTFWAADRRTDRLREQLMDERAAREADTERILRFVGHLRVRIDATDLRTGGTVAGSEAVREAEAYSARGTK